MFDRLAIIGTGLMGGSFGLAVRRSFPDLEIIGFDRAEILDKALLRGAITRKASSLEEAVRNADVVLLCTPVQACINLMTEISPFLAAGAIVTDVGSVKVPLEQSATQAFNKSVVYVGGHPMTGSESSGIQHADEFLYENATYVICPRQEEDHDSFTDRQAPLLDLISATGARILLMNAKQHDRIAAYISHLPQLVAVALVDAASSAQEKDPAMLRLAAGGFRDMTRIASSPYSVWREILDTNSVPILDAIDGLLYQLTGIRDSLADGNLEEIGTYFKIAEDTRSGIPPRSKGFLKPLSDVFVFITDRPGAIHEISGIMAGSNINIKDIELLKIREGTGGTFRLGLESESCADRALEVLTAAGLRAHRL